MKTKDHHSREMRDRYQITSYFYDLLDYPWERQYRKWRPALLADVEGQVLEAGVGTGHNLAHYRADTDVTGIDLSPGMLRRARKRSRKAPAPIRLLEADATRLEELPDDHFDWYIATFLYCVMPDALQPAALAEMARVLKPDGRFKLIEILYSQDPRIRRRQEFLAPFVRRVYGARFDRRTLDHLRARPDLEITRTSFLKDDTYLLIEGRKSV